MSEAQALFSVLKQTADPDVVDAIKDLVENGEDRALNRINLLDFSRSTGIDEEFLSTVQEQLVPGTSALIVISSDAREELVDPILARSEATLIAADLPEEARRRLDDLLGPPS